MSVVPVPARQRSQSPSRAVDWLLAFGCAALALAVYARTLYPGLAGVGSTSMDAPKFQFLGRVLGTAHNPGYPLYMVLTHVFGWLPLGRLAWRMNLFSAVCAASCVGLMYLVIRRLGCHWLAALMGSLGLAFGGVFWSQATIAEVYALTVFLVSAILLGLVGWSRTRHAGWLLLGFVAGGLSLGNHLTVVMIAPAIAAFIILSDWRTAVRPRVVLAAVACVALGLAQYGYIVLRTHQGAAHLESSARTVGELVDVVRGRQFSNRLFAFDASALVLERVPLLVRMLQREMGWLGCGLLLLGMVVLWRGRRWADGVLLVGGAGGVAGFVANYDVTDIQVFMLPAFVLLWPIAGVGLDGLIRASGRVRGAGIVAGVLTCTVPTVALVWNYRTSDHGDHGLPAAFFDALFARLPAAAAIVSENYSTDSEVRYMLFGEDEWRRHRVDILPADGIDEFVVTRPERPVFAFADATRRLMPQGYVVAPMRLLGPALPEYILTLPRSSMVALAVAGPAAASLGRRLRPDVSWEGVEAFAFVGRGGRPLEGELSVERTVHAGLTAQGLHLAIQAEQGRAEILGRDGTVAVAEDGAAFVVVRDGRVREAQALFAEEGWRMPLSRQRIGLVANRVVGRVRPVPMINSQWTAIEPSVPSSRVLLLFDPGRALTGPVAETTIYVGCRSRCAPRMQCDGNGTSRAEVQVFGATDAALSKALHEDGLPGRPFESAESVARVHVTGSDFCRREEGHNCRVDVGSVTTRAWMRSVSKVGVSASLVPAGGTALTGEDLFWMPLGTNDAAPYLGDGWDGQSRVRTFLLPLANAVEMELHLRMRGSGTVGLRWGATALSRQTLEHDWRVFGWRVPRELVRQGTNEARLEGSGDFEVSSLRMRAVPGASNAYPAFSVFDVAAMTRPQANAATVAMKSN